MTTSKGIMKASIYLLKRPNGRGNLKIRLNWNGQRFEKASGHTIELKHWDSDLKRVKRLQTYICTNLNLKKCFTSA